MAIASALVRHERRDALAGAVRSAFAVLATRLDESGLAGRDPYDALSSPLVRTLARGRAARLVAVQALKRSPLDLRPLLRVPKQVHTKTLALCCSAHSRHAELDEESGARALRLAGLLAERGVAGRAGLGFGYEFDVQTRWGEYERGRPNAVATAFAAHAFLDASELASDLRRTAVAALDYAFAHLLGDGPERCFAYYEGAPKAPIHNASMLLCGAAARLPELPEPQRRAAADAVAFTLARQRPDGSWPYGEAPGLAWVDGYHTAYLLDALRLWHEATGDPEALAALERGLDLYLRRLVDPDGAPRASLQSRYPVDTHAAATGITVLTRLSPLDPRAAETANRLVRYALARLRRPEGRFVFQRHRGWVNTVPYVRWSDAHMLLALATFLEAHERDG